MKNKIAVYTGSLDYSVAKGILAIIRHNKNVEIMVFVNHRQTPLKKKLVLQWRNLKKNGIYRLFEVSSIVFRSIYSKMITRDYNKFGCDVVTDYIREIQKHELVTICDVYNINSRDSVKIISDFSPCIGVSLAAPILKAQILDIAKKGNLNLHKGKLPSYRGMPPAYWEVKNGEKYVGCSIHLISELLDEGDILLEEEVKIEQWSTPKGLQVQLDELGITMMASACEQLLTGELNTRKQEGLAITYTKPTIKENQYLISKISKIDSNPIIKRFIKYCVLALFNNIYAPIRAHIKGTLGKQDIIILLYHRVNDFQRDSLTVGVEQFSEHMSYIGERFPVASLKSLIEGKVSRFEKKPIIIVSFDDGYLDNYQNAYPICLRNKIPCSFFVSTDMIETGKPFPHDNQLDIKLRNMCWDQLIEMKATGMYIGSHTCKHINCAITEDVELIREFKTSLESLHSMLGSDIAILAYPFGGQEHFNQKAKELAINVGYNSILSAYGGINSEVDVYDLKRGGVDWMFNHTAFKAKLLGWGNK